MPGASARSRAWGVVTGQPSAFRKNRIPFLRHQLATEAFWLYPLKAFS